MPSPADRVRLLASVLLTSVLLTLLLATSAAQGQVGTWRTYTDMKEITALAAAGDTIWAATSGGVFSYCIGTGRYTRVTNVEGLSDITVATIAVDGAGTVYTGSGSGMLNISSRSGWTVVPDIARATDKPSRGITCLKLYRSLLYIGTDFGVVVYNPARREFVTTISKFGTLPAQSAVSDLFFADDVIWVATDHGVATAPAGSGNLQDPSTWTCYTRNNGLPGDRINAIATAGGSIIAALPQGISVFSAGSWSTALAVPGARNVTRLVPSPDGTYACTERQLFLIVSPTDVRLFRDSTAPPAYPARARFTDLCVLRDGSIVAGTGAGMAFPDPGLWRLEKPNGPASNLFLSLSVDAAGLLWSASGGDTEGQGTYSFDGAEWRNYNAATDTALRTNGVYATHPASDGSMWFGLWGRGAAHRDIDGSIQRYDVSTVPGFPGTIAAATYTVVSGIAEDAQSTTWFVNFRNGDGTALMCRTAAGAWKFFSNAALTGYAYSDLAIDQYGNKWMHGHPGYGSNEVVVFNENGTLDNPSDDTWVRIDSRTLLNEGNSVLSTVVDRLGDVWIGTSLGLRTVFNPRAPETISRTCYNTRCNIEGQKVTCIAVDPVNNKWIGTSAGVFVLSSDGSTIIAQYAMANSPLLSDEIRSIVIHPVTGVAYIGTDKGLSSVVTPYMRAQGNSDVLRASPNPFRVGIDEQVTIDGLPEGATMKILTLSGSAVTEIVSPGGRVGFWDGRNASGTFVSSGIYIIVAWSADGSTAVTGKLAVVRP